MQIVLESQIEKKVYLSQIIDTYIKILSIL